MAKRDSLMAQCVLRAGRAIADEHIAAGRDPTVPPTRRETAKVMWQSTRLGSTVTALIVEWALALDDLEVDELGLERFAEWANDSRRTIYRRLDDFRRVWPEYHTPNELAALLLVEARRRGERPNPQLVVAA